MNDYRNTEFCLAIENIAQKKEAFKQSMIDAQPKITNFYKYLSDKDGQYKNNFLKLYNDKCAYCGNSLDNISIDLMEIDHYINEASFSVEEKINAHQIENLFPSCQTCNRKKSGITIYGDYIKILNPDGNEVAKVFYRDTKYNICISKQYENDAFIIDFYNKLAFGREQRRLDFLLLKMRGLHAKLKENGYVKETLLGLINTLQSKRNRMSID